MSMKPQLLWRECCSNKSSLLILPDIYCDWTSLLSSLRCLSFMIISTHLLHLGYPATPSCWWALIGCSLVSPSSTLLDATHLLQPGLYLLSCSLKHQSLFNCIIQWQVLSIPSELWAAHLALSPSHCCILLHLFCHSAVREAPYHALLYTPS